MAIPLTLDPPVRTLINSEEKITFSNSPIHLRVQNDLQDNTILAVTVYLWIWNGDQNKTLGAPNQTLFSNKISYSDDYVNFEISDLIRSYLIAPSNAPNTNQPTFVYNELTNPTITGQGVFWQIVTDVTSIGGATRTEYETNFATLGYRWNYEQNLIGGNALVPNGSNGFIQTANRYYNPKIHNYISQSFNLTNSVATCSTSNMITVTNVIPDDAWKRCAKDNALIVFLNKLGLWEMFTPNGKIVVTSKIKDDTSNRVFRDPSKIDNSFTHSKMRENLEVTQSHLVNTGLLQDDMPQIVEEIIYSPKVYLIKFKGDRQLVTTLGITIDSTYTTIDSLTITIDSDVSAVENLGYFKTHQQIPVTVTDNDYMRKTRVNDKSKIDYNIKFEETNNKINQIR